ncbi:MAG: DNA polymerase III subunit delta [Steroidobacteraceae bacterium]|jgi:DNA polymerase-3 subunit delta|nr:DNA polymerase III subunit delta [Steroidobacteraceae bacterium]
MKLTLENLAGHLQGRMAPVYLVSGDETLLVGEACDAIRASARAAGFAAREVHFIERAGDWAAVEGSVGTMSLFGDLRLLEIRLQSAKPGKEGGAVLASLARSGPDTLVLVVTPHLDRDAQASAWAKALAEAGAWLPVREVDAQQLPGWLAQRCRRVGLAPSDEAVALLAARVEGNLLAGQQEIDKLRLLVEGERLEAAQVLAAVADSSRYDVFRLSEAVLAGDAPRALRVLEGLRGEGVEPTLVLWALTRELRQLWALRQGGPGERGPWRPPAQAAALERARRRLPRFPFARLASRALRADRMIKGRLQGEPWDELLLLCAEFCGLRAPAPPRGA